MGDKLSIRKHFIQAVASSLIAKTFLLFNQLVVIRIISNELGVTATSEILYFFSFATISSILGGIIGSSISYDMLDDTKRLTYAYITYFRLFFLICFSLVAAVLIITFWIGLISVILLSFTVLVVFLIGTISEGYLVGTKNQVKLNFLIFASQFLTILLVLLRNTFDISGEILLLIQLTSQFGFISIYAFIITFQLPKKYVLKREKVSVLGRRLITLAMKFFPQRCAGWMSIGGSATIMGVFYSDAVFLSLYLTLKIIHASNGLISTTSIPLWTSIRMNSRLGSTSWSIRSSIVVVMMTLLTSCICAILLFFILPYILNFVYPSGAVLNYFHLFLFLLPMYSFSSVCSAFLIGYGKIKQVAVIAMTEGISLLTLLIIFAKYDTLGALIAFILSSCIFSVIPYSIYFYQMRQSS